MNGDSYIIYVGEGKRRKAIKMSLYGVDRKTGETKTEQTAQPDMTNARRRTDEAAHLLGLVRRKDAPTTAV